tara:strand:+ start:1022 stop:1258 length:237 start_codon:yes stop_codon:yes gene_type:complete
MTKDELTTALGEYHTYIRDNRKAIVLRNTNGFYVELYETDELIETRYLYNNSEHYAESCAENWVDMIIPTPIDPWTEQ